MRRKERKEARMATMPSAEAANTAVRCAAVAAGRDPDAVRATVIGDWWRIRRNSKSNEELGAGNTIEIAVARVDWSKVRKIRKGWLAETVRTDMRDRRDRREWRDAYALRENRRYRLEGRDGVPFPAAELMNEEYKRYLLSRMDSGLI